MDKVKTILVVDDSKANLTLAKQALDEIYQVSLDEDYHFWAQRSELLPWVCVFCEEGLQSDMVTLYRVDRVPTYFLIDRNCDLQARQEDIPNLRKAIEALL